MDGATFKLGGIHPPEDKDRTSSLAIEPVRVPEVVIPLLQHIGAPARACVEVGNAVLMGQEIGSPGGYVSTRIHASVSGEVTAVEPRPGARGVDVLSIVIANDGANRGVETTGLGDAWRDATPEVLRELVAAAGLVGMGGGAFPTHVKLSPPPGRPIDTVIINGAECEPVLTADHRLLLESPDDVIKGLLIAMRLLGARKGLIGIEANKPDAIEVMRKAAFGKDVGVVSLAVKYPQGSEKQLIDACAARQVPSGGLPMDVGVVVLNAGTAKAVADAVLRGRPLIERVVTISGTAIARPANLRARIGTPVSALIETCGGIKGELGKLVIGGPMMGLAQYTDQVPVTKGTSGVLLLSKEEVISREPDPCIRCGRCVRACPARISPIEIATFAERGMAAQAKNADAMDCIECGSCAFVCPSGIPLVQEIRLAKALIAASKGQPR